jgi:ubiquinone/menaquinone biosynthesis C-methylase UbiE
VSEADERALSFGSVAEDYEATRPGWPRAPFDEVLAHFGVRDEPDVVDIAAGTGKLTRTLAALAGTLVAVEPDPSLREVIQRVLPEVDVFAGTAEALPLADASADVATAGQAFHWFDVERALAEIARVLRPRGVVIAGWNSPPEEGTWYDAVIEFLHVANPDHLPARTRDWAVDFVHPAYGELFTATGRHEQASDHERFARLLGTHSIINLLPAARRAALIEQAVAVAVEQGAFAPDGSCAIPWRCELYALQRRD